MKKKGTKSDVRYAPKAHALAREVMKDLETDQPRTKGALMKAAGYSEKCIWKNAGQTFRGKHFLQELDRLGFNEESAKSVVAEILVNGKKDADRLTAADKIFKVLGSYAAEKTQNVNINIDAAGVERISGLASEIRSRIRESYAGGKSLGSSGITDLDGSLRDKDGIRSADGLEGAPVPVRHPLGHDTKNGLPQSSPGGVQHTGNPQEPVVGFVPENGHNLHPSVDV